ncbi:MAG: hypothetical protein DMF89_11065 [Acidobacteria bacterium]|nr:MAG: hypothetical protein DMF90_23050 [Acidobacteriota bacterium]PYR49930.1 MAG: hypothetical protein DMF89_11065 [Acidobacteriota bacterium]
MYNIYYTATQVSFNRPSAVLYLIGTSTGIKSVTEGLSDYRRRMALAIRIIVFGANREEI